jgi:hypothetical protein
MYVYKFLNNKGEIIYIGRTKDMNNRQTSHNHLSQQCYNETKQIQYIELCSYDEMCIYERYLINKITPKYNTEFNNNSDFSFELPEKEWKVYKKEDKPIKEYKNMSTKEKIDYHKKIGDLVLKENGKYVIYKKEDIDSNIENFKNLYTNCYFYYDIKKVLEFIFTFDNFCLFTKHNKEYKLKNLKYSNKIFNDINLKNKNNIICYDIEESKIIIFFNQSNYIIIDYIENDVEDIKNNLNLNFKFINDTLFQFENLERENHLNSSYWMDIIEEVKDNIKNYILIPT